MMTHAISNDFSQSTQSKPIFLPTSPFYLPTKTAGSGRLVYPALIFGVNVAFTLGALAGSFRSTIGLVTSGANYFDDYVIVTP